MKYNSALLNKFFNNINNTNDNTKKDKDIKVSPPTTTTTTSSTSSNINMAAVTNNTPISNSLVTSTRFTDEYDLKEELGK